MSEKMKLHGLQAMTVFSPVVALVLFQLAMKGPAGVQAGYMEGETPVLPDISEIDVASLAGVGPGDYGNLRSPFWFFVDMKTRAPDMGQMGQTVGLDQDQISSSDPVFSLSAVLPSAAKSLAVINGKARGVGDVVEPGWTLLKISGKDRYVIVQHTTGRRMRVLMK